MPWFDALSNGALGSSSGDERSTAFEAMASRVGADGGSSPELSSWEAREQMRRSRKVDEFEVRDVPDRLLPYEISASPPMDHHEALDPELLEKARTLLAFMPRNQARVKLEKLLEPNDAHRGRRAVDSLIAAGLLTEDERGRLTPGSSPQRTE